VSVGGNWSNSGTFAPGTSTVTFSGSSQQQYTRTGTGNFNNLTLNNSAGLLLNNNLTVNSTLTLTSGALTIGSNTVTISSGGSISASSGNLASGSNGGTVAFAGAGTVSGTVGFYDVTIAGAVNFGSASTINHSLTRFSAGSVSTNAPTYASGSTLIYDMGTFGFVATGLEWSTTSGAGYPYNVQVKNNSNIDLGSGGASTARQIAGTLTVDSGGELSMNATAMTAALSVLGNVSNSGTLDLSSLSGGDLKVQGNFTNNGTFAPNNGKVFFEGSNTQTVNASGSLTIPWIRINKSGGTVQLNTDVSSLGSSGVDSLQFTGTTSTLTLNGRTLTLGSTVSGGGSGSGLIGNSSSNLVLNDGGTSGAMGTLYFVSGGQTLNNLTINRTGTNASATVGSDVTVAGALTLTSGDIVMSGANTMTQTGTSAGSTDVLGNVRRTGFSNGAPATNAKSFGNPNVQISFQTGTPATEMIVNLVKSAPSGFSSAVTRTYTITPTGASGFTATLRLHYLDSELNGNTEAGLDLWRFNGSTWNRVVKTPVVGQDLTNNWAESNVVTAFSPWTLATNLNATAVKMSAARAESYAEGVLVSWESGREVDNLGYNVYRELGGARTRVNQSIVAGSALTVGAGMALGAGAGYQLWAAQASAAAQYWIEDIDLAGRRTMHGPFTPVAGDGDGARLALENRQPLLLSELNDKARHKSGVFQTGWAAAALSTRMNALGKSILSARAGELSEAQADAAQQQWEIAAGAAVKIGVRRDGWYRVTQAELAAAGLDPNADARFLQLYTDGQQLPMRVNSSQPSLGANDSIEFYARGLDTATTDTRIYWLVVGAQPGLRIAQPKSLKNVPGAGGGSKLGEAPDSQSSNTPEPESRDKGADAGEGIAPLAMGKQGFAYTVELKERLLYFSSLLNGDAENYFGQLITSQPVTETLTARHLATTGDGQNAQLEVALQGVTAGAHMVRVYVNDVQLDTLNFNALEHAVKVCAVPASLLREGSNTVKLSVDGATSDVSLVDYLRLTYAHAYTAENDNLLLNSPAKGTTRVDGFTAPNIHVLDVTDTEAVTELSRTIEATATGYAVRVPTADGSRTLLAFTDDSVGRAASVTANRPSAWHDEDESADMVIITHRSLRDSVLPLKALRESEGLRVSVIDVEDLFDEFTYGAHTPQAIKDFLEWTTTHWRQSPHYVLFVGDATIDPRNYEGRGDFDLVPTKLIDTASLETASDEWFADFTGDGAATTMALGRLPVRTAQEASAVVAKIVGFMPDAANRSALLVADRSGTNDLDFAAASRSVGSQLPPDIATTFINRDDGAADTVRSRIVSEINAGPMIVNFMGHGSTTYWTGGQLLRTSDAAAFSNGNRLPLFVMMTCLNGYFTGTGIDSLSEAVLKSPQGGAIAVWASSGVTVPVEQQTANRELYRQLFGADSTPTLGDAVRRAKQVTQDPDIRRTWSLFGDPAMKLR
jgi:hypothetical protein